MKKNSIVSAMSVLGLVFSQVSFAEITMIEDDELSSVTGQKGLTIDIEMGIEIGEFMYKDAGSIVMQGIRLGGMDRSTGGVGTAFEGSKGLEFDINDPTANGYGGNTGLNNVRVEVDVSGDGSDLTNNGPIFTSPFPPFTTIYATDNQFMGPGVIS